jgi:hypothetical protein
MLVLEWYGAFNAVLFSIMALMFFWMLIDGVGV